MNSRAMMVGQMPPMLPQTDAMKVDLTLTLASVLAVFSVVATSVAVGTRRRRCA